MVMARLSWPRTSLTSPFGGAAAATGLGATWNAGGSCRTPIRRCRSNRVIRKLVSEYGLTLPANISIILPFPPKQGQVRRNRCRVCGREAAPAACGTDTRVREVFANAGVSHATRATRGELPWKSGTREDATTSDAGKPVFKQ